VRAEEIICNLKLLLQLDFPFSECDSEGEIALYSINKTPFYVGSLSLEAIKRNEIK
jgi:hypothetical protein